MDLAIAGRSALITGASRGVGEAVARLLAAEGAKVTLTARDQPALDAVAAGIVERGGAAIGAALDLATTDLDGIAALVERATTAHGSPAILVHCAASTFVPTKLHDLAAGELARLLQLDLSSGLLLCRAVLPAMMLGRWGRIVLVGSQASQAGQAGGLVYSAAKAGLEGAARTLAIDYGRYGITANVARLGFVDGDRLARRLDESGDPAARRAALERHTAARRLPGGDDVAAAIAFLCADQAWTVNGAAIDIDAGAHLNLLW